MAQAQRIMGIDPARQGDEGVSVTIGLAPGALAALGNVHLPLPRGARLVNLEMIAPGGLRGPAVLLLGRADLYGPRRPELLAHAQAALPGRPVLYGGLDDRDVLLEALNVWRVSRVVPESAPIATLGDALFKACAALRLEMRLRTAVVELRRDTQVLQETLTEVQEAQRQAMQSERLATLGRITASLVPELASHLDSLEGFGQTVDLPASDPELRDLVGYAVTGVRGMRALLDEIRDYAESRPQSRRDDPVNVDEMVKLAALFARFDPLATGHEVQMVLGSAATVRGDRFHLHQALLNLIRNAFQAAPANTALVVRTQRDGPNALIDIENEGPEVPPAVAARLFEPFFSTKGEKGLGLGLSLCKATAEAHGGTIAYSRTHEERTRFRIVLPVAV